MSGLFTSLSNALTWVKKGSARFLHLLTEFKAAGIDTTEGVVCPLQCSHQHQLSCATSKQAMYITGVLLLYVFTYAGCMAMCSVQWERYSLSPSRTKVLPPPPMSGIAAAKQSTQSKKKVDI